MKQVFTIGEVLDLIEKEYDNPKALVSHTEKGWQALSTRGFIQQVKTLIFGLLSIGVEKGDKVGIVALPSAEWTCADYAIMGMGAVSVPIFANISLENFKYEIKQTGLKIVFVGGKDQWTRITENSHLFDHIIGLDNQKGAGKVISYAQFLKKGKEYAETQNKDAYQVIKPSDIATIIFTSGSTGVPKGAVHTHHSVASLLNDSQFNWDNKSDSYLSFLPLAHVYARVLNLTMTSWGISTYYYNDVKHLGAVCQEVRPSVLVVVPRLLEKVYAKMYAKVESSNFIQKWMGRFAFALAHQEKKSLMKTLFAPLMDTLVYSKLRGALGGRLRVIFSGGAALNPHLYHFFVAAGFPIYEGWGLTESCPICVNVPGKVKIGTVGRPLPGMMVKVGPEGELLAKGEMLMNGYSHLPNETPIEAIDSEGWLHTGDKGTIDADGYVAIVGRFKELFKSSVGEWIAPIPLEQALTRVPFINSAIVIAENRKFASALLVPEFEALHLMKQKRGMERMSDEDFLNSAQMRQEMAKVLEKINAKVDEWSQIKDFRFIPHPLSIEEGELTPSLKVRREKVESKYRDLIESIYKE